MVTAAELVYSTCSTQNQDAYASIDLHRNRFTCLRALGEWPELFERMETGGSAAPHREAAAQGGGVAVEVTGNTRLFYEAVGVDPNQFQVISQSVKKTDPNDARNLALYLEKDLLPEVRMKDRTQAQLASLTQTRDTLVKLRTALKNMVNNILSTHGINLEEEALASERKLNE